MLLRSQACNGEGIRPTLPVDYGMLPESLVQYLSNGRDILLRLSAWRMDQQLCLHLPWHRLAKPSEIPLQQFFTKGFHNKLVA